MAGATRRASFCHGSRDGWVLRAGHGARAVPHAPERRCQISDHVSCAHRLSLQLPFWGPSWLRRTETVIEGWGPHYPVTESLDTELS